MTRIFHSDQLEAGKEIELDDTASQHLSRVMRVKVGDKVKVFNSTGEYLATIQTVTKKTVRVLLKESIDNRNESALKITLLQAVTRRERMDYAIQKATELGVTCIQPMMTDHCVVKIDAKKEKQKINHWRGIARHATEQSGRLCIPNILPIIRFNKAIENDNNALKLIFAVRSNSSLKTIDKNSNQIALALGPVGGFSDAEVQAALSHNFHSIKLGPRIMRAETATVAALTATQMLWGDLV